MAADPPPAGFSTQVTGNQVPGYPLKQSGYPPPGYPTQYPNTQAGYLPQPGYPPYPQPAGVPNGAQLGFYPGKSYITKR